MGIVNARYAVGQIMRHTLFGYRSVIIDVDANYQGTNEWYEKNAPSQPPKNEPWYLLLVHGSVHHAYAAESQLEPDISDEPIEHPEIDYFFDDFQNGNYVPHRTTN